MIRQHILSVIGQVAAALPPVLVMVFLSRTAGLELAGSFAIAAGVSAATFSTAHWGLRTSVLLDRLKTIDARTYLIARLLALTVAAAIVMVVARILNIDDRLIAGLILYKVCDGLVELDFAVTQVLLDTAHAIETFARLHAIKLLLLIAGISMALISEWFSVYTAFVFSGLIAIIVVWRRMYPMLAARPGSGLAPRAVWQVFTSATWFAIAASLCAIVTGAPRFSLAWLYVGDVIGVIGVTLSASTFIGMIFYTTWTRHVPNFDGRERFRSVAIRFLAESLLIGVVIFAISWVWLPQIVSFIFDYDEPRQLLLTRQVLVASILFFAGMNSCNLYKVTDWPWLESVSYLLALVAAVTVAVVNPTLRETHLLLSVSGSAMLLCGLIALRAPALVTHGRNGA